MANFGGTLQGKRIAIVGRLASLSRRELAHLLRQQGAKVLERPGPEADILILGEGTGEALSKSTSSLGICLPASLQEAAAEGHLELVPESQLWERLGIINENSEIHRLYTPAMLAELLRVPLAQLRRWYQRGWLRPAKVVHKLPYFDFQEVTVARRLAELYQAGATTQTILRQMADLSRCRPDLDRPLGQLPLRIEGKQILLWDGDRLMEPGGQLRLEFEGVPTQAEQNQNLPQRPGASSSAAFCLAERFVPTDSPPYYSPEEMVQIAMQFEETGQLREAAEMLRAALAAAGPSPELCFQLAELLYRMGDLSGARERYYMAIELDEDFVEARCNLGCLLAETGETELAVAALQGALAYHPHYADAHYHLARLLDQLGRTEQAKSHWRSFLALAPESPWSQQAQTRLIDQNR